MSFATDPELARRCAQMRRKCPWCERWLRPCNTAHHIAAAHFRQMTIDEMLEAMPEAYEAIEGKAA